MEHIRMPKVGPGGRAAGSDMQAGSGPCEVVSSSPPLLLLSHSAVSGATLAPAPLGGEHCDVGWGFMGLLSCLVHASWVSREGHPAFRPPLVYPSM